MILDYNDDIDIHLDILHDYFTMFQNVFIYKK